MLNKLPFVEMKNHHRGAAQVTHNWPASALQHTPDTPLKPINPAYAETAFTHALNILITDRQTSETELVALRRLCQSVPKLSDADLKTRIQAQDAMLTLWRNASGRRPKPSAPSVTPDLASSSNAPPSARSGFVRRGTGLRHHGSSTSHRY